MKIRHILCGAFAALSMFSLASCSEGDDYPELPQPLYQQYEVYIQDGSKAGFANFRLGDADGKRVRLEGDRKVSVNGKRLLYTPSTSETYPEFNYSEFIDNTAKEAKFELRIDKGKTLTNTVGFGDIATVTVGKELKSLSNGQTLSYTVNGSLKNNDSVHISMVAAAGNDKTVYQANVYFLNNTFEFKDVPEGTYHLRLDVYRVEPTRENDGSASGSIRVIRRKLVNEVRVVNSSL